jgi:hypothetical protein
MMHAFALVMGSMMAHPWVKGVLTNVQRIVTFFKASPRMMALLVQNAVNFQTTVRRFATANKTRFTSVEVSLSSVLALKDPLKSLVRLDKAKERDGEKRLLPDWMHRMVSDERGLWEVAEVAHQLLVPYSKVIMAVQSDATTLSDMPRYWAYLANELMAFSRLPNVDPGTPHALLGLL